MFGLGSLVFAKKSLERSIRIGTQKTINFGKFGIPEKGSTFFVLKVFNTDILLVNSHLPSGWTKKEVIERAKKIDIIHNFIKKDEELEYDIMFWAGDFNLRCFFDFDNKREAQPDSYFHPEDLIEMIQMEELKHFSEEHSILRQNYTDVGLTELPPYKVQKNNEKRKYVTNRSPSWTDRFFYNINTKDDIQLEHRKIRSIHFKYSDHM